MSRHRILALSVDLSLVAVAATVGAVLSAPLWTAVAAQIGAASLLLLRRHRPYAMVVALAAINLLTPVWASFLAAYAVTAHGKGAARRRVAAIVLLVATFLAGARAWTIDDPFSAPAVILFSALLGLYARTRRGLLAELTDRAERAERERLLLADQARADERIRLAGEMHDVVTHRINLMVLQAGALRVTAPDEPTRAAAENLRVAGCQALDELRDLVGVLRSGESPPPPDEGLAELIGASQAVGQPVRLSETGDPRQPAPAVRRTLYRVVQESLTNVRKHAPGAPTLVTVDYGHQQVRVSICNEPSSTLVPTELPAGLLPARAAATTALEAGGYPQPETDAAEPRPNIVPALEPGSRARRSPVVESVLLPAGRADALPRQPPGGQDQARGTADGERGGHGLAGLRHRVAVIGGELTASATTAGGFIVLATLPAHVPTGRA